VCFFIPESQLARAYLGQKVAFERDNGPADLGGTISFIAPQAEYTLPFIFSESNRGKLVFLAEGGRRRRRPRYFNPGERVTGTPAAGRP
jgi:HlyD family secretion protein